MPSWRAVSPTQQVDKQVKKAFSYTRVSTDRQEDALRTQDREIEHYIKEHDIEVIDSFSDGMESGRKNDRVQFNAMMSRLDEVDAIVVQDWSRISRDKFYSSHLLWKFHSSGIEIHSTLAGRPLDYENPTDFLLHHLKVYTYDVQKLEEKKKQIAGIKRYRDEFGHWGRPKRVLTAKEIKEYQRLRDAGVSKKAIARIFDISLKILYRNIREMELEDLKTLEMNKKK